MPDKRVIARYKQAAFCCLMSVFGMYAGLYDKTGPVPVAAMLPDMMPALCCWAGMTSSVTKRTYGLFDFFLNIACMSAVACIIAAVMAMFRHDVSVMARAFLLDVAQRSFSNAAACLLLTYLNRNAPEIR